MSLIVFFLLISAGTIYFLYILEKYEGDRQDAIAAWILLVIISCYNLYTFYYDALLIGKGYVKRDQQFTIISQSAYLLIAIILIFSGFGLTAIVCSKLISIIIRRYLSYKTFFTDQMKSLIKSSIPSNDKEILKIITPNAAKVGVTNLGGFLVNKSAFFIGAAYLSLEEIASFGITLHIIDLISNCGNVVYKSYLPKLAECRANSNNESLRKLFIICCGMMILVYILGGLSLLLFGDWVIELIGSKTPLLASGMILAMLTISYLECNHSMASGFISADNRIPFFIPSILSGGLTILLLWLFVCKFSWALWGMILAPGIAQFVYQNWKWPSVVIKELFVEGNIK